MIAKVRAFRFFAFDALMVETSENETTVSQSFPCKKRDLLDSHRLESSTNTILLVVAFDSSSNGRKNENCDEACLALTSCFVGAANPKSCCYCWCRDDEEKYS